MIYYFIYETTCLTNGKKYRGMHKTDNVNDKYLGSGVAFRHAVNKYGKENFNREILEYCDSYDELIEKEKVYVNEDWIKSKNNYNLKTGGQSVGLLSEESKKKISETLKKKHKNGEIEYVYRGHKHTEEEKKIISDTLTEFWKNKEHHLKFVDPWNKGLKGAQVGWCKGLKLGPMSDEHKDKISKTLKERYKIEEHPTKGKTPWNKGLIGAQVAWNKGKKITEKFKCPHCGKKADKGNAKRWHFDNCKHK